jgi:hypothetical protein
MAVHICWTYHSARPSHRLDAGSVRKPLTGLPLSKRQRALVSAAFNPAVTSYADADRLLRTEPQVQLTNPPVLNNHSNDFKSHLHPQPACRPGLARRRAAGRHSGAVSKLNEPRVWLELRRTLSKSGFTVSFHQWVIRLRCHTPGLYAIVANPNPTRVPFQAAQSESSMTKSLVCQRGKWTLHSCAIVDWHFIHLPEIPVSKRSLQHACGRWLPISP